MLGNRPAKLTSLVSTLLLISILLVCNFESVSKVDSAPTIWDELYHQVFEVGAKPLVPLQTNRKLVEMKKIILKHSGDRLGRINISEIQALIDVAKFGGDYCYRVPFFNIDSPTYQQVADQLHQSEQRQKRLKLKKKYHIGNQPINSSNILTNIDVYIVHYRKEQTLNCLTHLINDLKKAGRKMESDQVRRLENFAKTAISTEAQFRRNQIDPKSQLYQTKFLHVSIIEACIVTMKEVLDRGKFLNSIIPHRMSNFANKMQLQISDLCDRAINTLGPILRSIMSVIHKDDYSEISNLLDEEALQWISNVMVCHAYERESGYYEMRARSDFKKRFPSLFGRLKLSSKR